MTTELLLVTTTVATRDDALSLAQHVVSAGLAACVQMSEVESVYRWDGVVQHEVEWRLALKTTVAMYEPLQQAILERHPYELPAIFAVPVAAAYAPYQDWVGAQLNLP